MLLSFTAAAVIVIVVAAMAYVCCYFFSLLSSSLRCNIYIDFVMELFRLAHTKKKIFSDFSHAKWFGFIRTNRT